MSYRVLGIDPGFQYVGWAVCDATRQGEKICSAGLIESARAKLEADVLHEHVRRVGQIMAELADRAEGCEWIVIEYTASTRTGMVMGAIMRLAQERRLPLTMVMPSTVKALLLGPAARGVKVDRKAAVHTLMLERHPSLAEAVERVHPKRREHPIDAAAVVRAALLGDTGLRRALIEQANGAGRRRVGLTTGNY